jgi:hypothetical protein
MAPWGFQVNIDSHYAFLYQQMDLPSQKRILYPGVLIGTLESENSPLAQATKQSGAGVN